MPAPSIKPHVLRLVGVVNGSAGPVKSLANMENVLTKFFKRVAFKRLDDLGFHFVIKIHEPKKAFLEAESNQGKTFKCIFYHILLKVDVGPRRPHNGLMSGLNPEIQVSLWAAVGAGSTVAVTVAGIVIWLFGKFVTRDDHDEQNDKLEKIDARVTAMEQTMGGIGKDVAYIRGRLEPKN